MKFGAQLENDLVKEWAEGYVNYKQLKKVLAELEEVGHKNAYLLFKCVRFRECGEKGDPSKSIVNFALSDWDAQRPERMKAIKEVAEHLDCEILQGVSPATPLEREVKAEVKRLEDLVESLKK